MGYNPAGLAIKGRTGCREIPRLFQMDIGFESAERFGKLLENDEFYLGSEYGVYCFRCNEDIEYPYDEPHDCIECYHCGEHDMCICKKA